MKDLPLEYKKPERIQLKNHSEYHEKWVQKIIADDPTIIGLGDLELRDRERIQPKAGRLDLLLIDPDTKRRYEVELQLGPTDATHIIRSIEYWDIERKRYPQYDHCAVLIAEDVTSRFLNVISLFNGTMPFIAIQLQALKIDNWIILVFTKVLDELSRGLVDEDEDVNVTPANRAFWIEKARIETVELMDAMLQKIIAFDSTSTWELNYTKYHVGIKKNGQVNNFVQFKPTMSRLNLSLKLPQTDEIDKKIDDAGLALISYDRWGKYNLSLTDDDIEQKSDLLRKV